MASASCQEEGSSDVLDSSCTFQGHLIIVLLANSSLEQNCLDTGAVKMPEFHGIMATI
ncbi:hypothetical protein MJK70_17390 [Klebsiella pneumoniae]|nr:hypothetical protein MJK70_17390 [Klebsiella pneumoniae]